MDLQSELKLTFVYDTAILWQDGIGSPPEAELQGVFVNPVLVPASVYRSPYENECTSLMSVLIGAMYPTSMRINEDGRLVVNFKTEARFSGQFVMSHPGKRVVLTPRRHT